MFFQEDSRDTHFLALLRKPQAQGGFHDDAECVF